MAKIYAYKTKEEPEVTPVDLKVIESTETVEQKTTFTLRDKKARRDRLQEQVDVATAEIEAIEGALKIIT